MSQCIDVSNFDVPFTTDTVGCFIAAGKESLIIGCQRPVIATQQIDTARAVGLPIIGVYAYLYWGYDVGSEVQNAIDVAKAKGQSRVWLDCENGGELPGVGVDTRHPQLAQAVAQVRAAGLEPGIYTGKYFWQDSMGNSTEFASLPLWHASYWNDRHLEETVNYGGWTKVAIHQYASTPELCGRNRDYDYVWETDMTEEEIKQLVTDTIAAEFRDFTTAYFTGGFTLPDGTPIPVDAKVAAAIASIAKTTASGIPAHAHSFGPTTTGGVA